jgi:hypothetical protein
MIFENRMLRRILWPKRNETEVNLTMRSFGIHTPHLVFLE